MNLADALGAAAQRSPDRSAIVGPEACSHAELLAASGAVATQVSARCAPGDRVAIVAGNEAAFVTAYLGVLRAGAVAVPLNPTAPSHELAREIDVVTPALVLASEAFADLARRAAARANATPAVEAIDMTNRASTPPGATPRDANDLAALLFTAGTAGEPRPAMLTHGSLLANIEQMQSHPGLRMTSDDVVLGVLPFFHVYGLNVVLGLTLAGGGAVSIVDHFHPAESVARVRNDGVTTIAAVPAIYDAWLALDEATAPNGIFDRVRLCVSGASALAIETARAFRDRFGVVVHDGYGLTEASPVVTTSAISPDARSGSVGPPLPGVEVRLVDNDGNSVLADDPGEIVVRGANVFAGYWNDPDATAAVLRDGWLRTGDIAIADRDGWLTLVDRAKDLIIVSGFNVYPGEVEDALRSHPDVEDVAVIGEPHPRTGETVVAYVVARPGHQPDPVELLRYGARRLARYKLPTRVEVVDELPRSLVGKLSRSALAGRATRPPDATTKPA
jgi:long-chain acyl-CoA synthetase